MPKSIGRLIFDGRGVILRLRVQPPERLVKQWFGGAGDQMRGALRGFVWVAGAVLVVDVAILVRFGAHSERAAELWWLVNFPSVPFLLCCAGPPPMGEAEIHPWDYWAVAVSLVSSCACWGAVGALLGWLAGLPGGGRDAPSGQPPAPAPSGQLGTGSPEDRRAAEPVVAPDPRRR